MARVMFMKRIMSSLVPTTRNSEEVLLAMPLHVIFKVTATQPRNVDHHQKYWALIDAIFPHQEQYATTRHLHEAIKLSIGHFDMIKTLKGKDVPVTRETNFNAMDQHEFEEFYERAVNLILTRILPGVGRRDLEAQVLDILAGRREPAPSSPAAGRKVSAI